MVPKETTSIDDRIGAHVRGASRAGHQRELAERHAGRQRGESLRLPGLPGHEDAHAALEQEVHGVRRLADAQNELTGRKAPSHQERLERGQPGFVETATDLLRSQGRAHAGVRGRTVAFQQALFAPFERAIQIGEIEAARGLAALCERFLDAAQQSGLSLRADEQHELADRASLEAEIAQQARRGRIGALHALHVEQHELDVVARFRDAPNDRFHGAEHEVILQLVHGGAIADRVEQLAVTLGAARLRSDAPQTVGGADDGP